jgi:hypothetical protein
MAFKSNVNNFGGVVVYSYDVTDTELLNDIDAVIASKRLVYNMSWVGQSPDFKSNQYTLEKAFYNEEDYLTDYSKVTLSIFVWETFRTQFEDMKILKKILGDAQRNGLDVTKNWVWVCPRFDFNGETQPTYELMKSNVFYKCKVPSSFMVEDIGNVGAGQQQTLKFNVLKYSEDFGKDGVYSELVEIIGSEDQIDDYILIGTDNGDEDYIMVSIQEK